MFIMNVMDNDRRRHVAAALRAAEQVLAEICDSMQWRGRCGQTAAKVRRKQVRQGQNDK